ncbi:MAG TPA: amidohydrolase family protein, partial [Ilumatobacteraceae bacterium]
PCGVVGSVLVQCLAEVAETHELLIQADRDPLVAGVVGYVDLTAGDAGEQLDALRESVGGSRLVGVRHVVEREPDPDWLSRPQVVAGLREVATRGLVYDLLIRPDQFEAAVAAVRAVPEGRFVLDHLGKPPIARSAREPWASHLSALARCPNVGAKVSALLTEADWLRWTAADVRPYLHAALDTFGSSRLMFGSDWPVCLLAADYARQLETIELLMAELSVAEQAAIFHDNAVETYQLTIKEGTDA